MIYRLAAEEAFYRRNNERFLEWQRTGRGISARMSANLFLRVPGAALSVEVSRFDDVICATPKPFAQGLTPLRNEDSGDATYPPFFLIIAFASSSSA